ncbi:hypothetical protein Plo01_25840 [Planobispora longispora]|uniref:Uncharacterized protein n=1 Tax=Planobispora longispora TaxID=28887 RepID=A0A8J3RJQ3_9ACTN|nr:hypothetical protein GCM10020093_084120 [Planobispora longispora]GIH76155.1 hypothetical protein Plo01_25840 [Planobispora longispora]
MIPIAPDHDGWTVYDAEDLLHPAMTQTEIRAMIVLFGINPIGTRREPGRAGRAPVTYNTTALQVAHAAVIRTRVDLQRIDVA